MHLHSCHVSICLLTVQPLQLQVQAGSSSNSSVATGQGLHQHYGKPDASWLCLPGRQQK
jgi:hypothetical protein